MALKSRHTIFLGLHKRKVSVAGVETIQLDLESEAEFEEIVKTLQPQIVIHTVALTNIEECEVTPELARQVNVEITQNVVRVCARWKLQLVHISTDHLFSGNLALQDEDSPLEPVNIYGKTKAEAESVILSIDPAALVIRCNFFGWGTSYRQSFSDYIYRNLLIGKRLTLFSDVFFTPIIANAIAFAVHKLLDRKLHGIFHIVGDERISKYEFGLRLAEEFNLDKSLISPCSIDEVPGLVQRPKDMSLSNRKVCKVLNQKLGSVHQHLSELHRQLVDGTAIEMQRI